MTADLAWFARDLRSLALELGGPVTLYHVTAGTYDPATGSTSQTADAGHLCLALLTKYRGGLIDGQAIQNGDLALNIPTGQLDQNGDAVPDPAVTDRVAIGSASYTIVNVNPVGPTGAPLIWVAQIRK
jgi:hypothetical protein